MLSHSWLRRKFSAFLIEPRFQLSFVGVFLIISLINFVILLAAVQILFWNFKRNGELLQLGPDSPYVVFINHQHGIMNWVFAAVGLFSTVLVAAAGVILSHRVAGPIHRLIRHFETSSQSGKIGNVSFRKKDYFQNLSAAVNKFVESQKH